MKAAVPRSAVWRRPGFRTYLGSTAFSGLAVSMQQLLLSWLLIGVLLLPADQVGALQAVIGVPGVFLMLWGGASADRVDPRSLLVRIYSVAPLLPLGLALASEAGWLNLWTVATWGLGVSVVVSFSQPAQQAILNRVSGSNVQQGVTAATAIMFMVQMVGLATAGQMERVGLTPVLAIQTAAFALGAMAARRIAPVPGPVPGLRQTTWRGVLAGFRAVYADRVIFDVLCVNFVSAIFNAGAFMTVFPFIIKRVYTGDAALLAGMMVVFFAGAMVSNIVMFRLMPIARPGRVFLLSQLTRIVILFCLWVEPPWWLLVAVVVGWGLNMGVTSTLARTIVQESAQPEYRGRVLSVFTLGQMGSAPIGAVLLGHIIEAFGALNALIPAMLISVALFVYGSLRRRVWGYMSGEPARV